MATAKKLPSGNYRVRVYIGTDADRKAQYKSFTAQTKKEAEFMAAQYSRTNVDVCRSDMLLKQAIERYIQSKENVLSPSTIRGYYVVLRNYLPELMQMQIKKITPEIVQREFNKFARDYKPKTCRNAHGLITSVLKVYRPELQLKTTLPQKEKRDICVPDEQDVKRIYKLIKGDILEIPFVLATQCGLRASEISGLTLKNVYKDHIEIKQARVDGIDGAVLKAPKSVSGYRKIPITEFLYRLLKDNAYGESVCALKSNDISSRWGKFRDKHKLPAQLNFHALRHHYASKCLLLGMPQKYIAELMGHSSLDMIERVYQHTFPSAMEIYADKIRQSMTAVLS
ncbi:MAG: site-specific integrase [Lachnospiraceae bacterium]|nr:site-specific integrase [Lachnospiraceae bacterium]